MVLALIYPYKGYLSYHLLLQPQMTVVILVLCRHSICLIQRRLHYQAEIFLIDLKNTLIGHQDLAELLSLQITQMNR